MKAINSALVVLGIAGLFACCASAAYAQGGRVVYETIHSTALEGNLLGDPADKELSIYLPPGYDESDRRYPVVYFIHGYLTGRQNRIWFIPMFHTDAIFDSLITIEKIPPFIAVMPNGDNRYEGSWYVSNRVSGDFEKYIVYEIPEFIEKKFRVIPGRDSRALTGHSMGGYGAAYLGTKYGREYAAIGIMSGGMNLYSESRMEGAKSTAIPVPSSWDELMKLHHRFKGIYSRSAAWSPNPDNPPFYVDVPVYVNEEGETVSRPSVWMRWKEYSPLHMLPAYQSNLRSLDGIVITTGSDEGAVHSSDEYHAALLEYNIRHEYHVIFGDHLSVMPESIRSVMRVFMRIVKHEE